MTLTLVFVSGGIAILGLLALILVLGHWPWLHRWYHELWAKVASALFRLGAAVAAIVGKFTTQPDGPWFMQSWFLMLIAGIGYCLWELAGAIGDHKLKREKEKKAEAYETEIVVLQKDKLDVEYAARRLRRLISTLSALVYFKLQRVRTVINEPNAPSESMKQVRKGLNADEQIHGIADALARYLREFADSETTTLEPDFRVGLYAEENGYLVPVDAFSLKSRSHSPFRSFSEHREQFRLDSSTASHAVRAIRHNEILIVENCEEDPEFVFFNEAQHNYLKSMIACPLVEFRRNGIENVKAVLVIDTDVPGYFRVADRLVLRFILDAFVARLQLEYSLRRLSNEP